MAVRRDQQIATRQVTVQDRQTRMYADDTFLLQRNVINTTKKQNNKHNKNTPRCVASKLHDFIEIEAGALQQLTERTAFHVLGHKERMAPLQGLRETTTPATIRKRKERKTNTI